MFINIDGAFSAAEFPECGVFPLAGKEELAGLIEIVSETPSNPDSWFTIRSNCDTVIFSLRARNKINPGSMSPVRVAIIKPAAGGRAMEGYTLWRRRGSQSRICSEIRNTRLAIVQYTHYLFCDTTASSFNPFLLANRAPILLMKFPNRPTHTSHERFNCVVDFEKCSPREVAHNQSEIYHLQFPIPIPISKS